MPNFILLSIPGLLFELHPHPIATRREPKLLVSLILDPVARAHVHYAREPHIELRRAETEQF